MSRPTAFGAVCEHGRLARKCERCDDADEIASLRDCAKQYEQWLAQDHATIADLRDRLRVLEPMVCRCGYHALGVGKQGELWPLCPDCMISLWGGDGRAAACLANGMKALCGRKLLEGC